MLGYTIVLRFVMMMEYTKVPWIVAAMDLMREYMTVIVMAHMTEVVKNTMRVLLMVLEMVASIKA